MTAPTAPTLDVEALRTAPESTFALAAVLAEDVEWIEVDQRTQPRSPAVLRGREAVLEMIADAESRGITSRVTDGFAAGDRAAMTVTCSYAGGGQRALQRARSTCATGRSCAGSASRPGTTDDPRAP